MVLFHHLNHNRQRDDEGCIDAGCDVNGVAVAEDGELSTNACKQIASVIAYAKIPLPYITIDVEYHTITTFHFEGLAEQAKLLVHARPVLTVAINLIVWQK